MSDRIRARAARNRLEKGIKYSPETERKFEEIENTPYKPKGIKKKVKKKKSTEKKYVAPKGLKFRAGKIPKAKVKGTQSEELKLARPKKKIKRKMTIADLMELTGRGKFSEDPKKYKEEKRRANEYFKEFPEAIPKDLRGK